jgi:hypothetical protein
VTDVDTVNQHIQHSLLYNQSLPMSLLLAAAAAASLAASGVGAGGCCNAANFFDSHAALIKITGAIVGGPDQSDNYPDLRPDYQRSEVALDYNAGFTGAAAALAQYAAAGQLAACGAGE